MLFNSYEFLFAFLPIVVLVYYMALGRSTGLATLWLAAASIGFYAWWSRILVVLLLCSVVLNYIGGRAIESQLRVTRSRAKAALAIFVAADLGILGYFKYFNFLSRAASDLTGIDPILIDVVLPVGISFYTFTQIAYLVDIYHEKTKSADPVSYLLFVTYFPHLVAGPILHHAEMLPQFRAPGDRRDNPLRNLSMGWVMLAIGLFKKVCIADPLGRMADVAFGAVAEGHSLQAADAWCGALSYAFQLYFDFSGYSDMAIGLSFMLGIKLPINFWSPYQAGSIIEFWQRWHISLSRFLRDYLYIPLGGNRHGILRRYINIFVTMLLGGLWHGASWTFVVWGAYHGVLLCLNHWIRRIVPPRPARAGIFVTLSAHARKVVVFGLVVIGWVMFRSDSWGSARTFIASMVSPLDAGPAASHLFSGEAWAVLAVLYLVVAFAPNSVEIVGSRMAILDSRRREAGVREGWFTFAPTFRWAVASTLLFVVSALFISTRSAFLYFQF